jgi:hypothetical protein
MEHEMTARKVGAVLAITCATALVAPIAASAKVARATTTQATSLTRIPVTGTAHNGKAFAGHMTVTQFVTRHGQTFALGQLTGRLGHRRIGARQVAVPVTVPGATPTAGVTPSAVVACPVLHLVLGPLNLNLLGLTVSLNQVVLDITAVPGAGNLLGNLLCSVANLLNTQSILGQELTGLLNIVQQLLNVPALQGL